MAQILSPDAFGLKAPENPLLPRKSHFSSKAKRVIYIHLTGSPPHLDLWDYKPELVKRTDQECPDEFIKGKQFAFTSGTPKLMGTPREFSQHGKSGMWMSDAIPHLHKHADDLCVIKSMHTDQFNHAPAELFVHTWFSSTRASFFWCLDHLRIGFGKPGPSGICCFISQVEPSQTGERIHLVPGLFLQFIRAFSADQKGTLFYMFPILRVWIVV